MCTTSLVISHITNNLGSIGGNTFFGKIQDGVPLKKKNFQHHNTKALATVLINTTFDQPEFPLDNTFNDLYSVSSRYSVKYVICDFHDFILL
jgi:hypothetical protein